MKLSQLFTGSEVHRGQSEKQSVHVAGQTASVGRQIQSLVPGQTIRGEILTKNGQQILVKLSDDFILQAKVNSGVHLEEGQNITFEVKNNGTNLLLSPLFTNTASDANLIKALEMAGLPVQKQSVEMTRQLMEASLPINRKELQQVFREVNSYPENEISDIITLHKLQLPVNKANMEQMSAYRNLQHQMLSGINQIQEELLQLADHLVNNGELNKCYELIELLYSMQEINHSEFSQIPGVITNTVQSENRYPDFADSVSDKEIIQSQTNHVEVGNVSSEQTPIRQTISELELLENSKTTGNTQTTENTITTENTVTTENSLTTENITIGNDKIDNLTDHKILLDLGIDQGTIKNLVKEIAEKYLGTGKISQNHVHQLFVLLQKNLKEQWIVKPDELIREGKINELYERLDKQLKELAKGLENVGAKNTGVYQAVSNMSNNIDFMNQINQMYTYVQLPLKLQESEAHGELYVYTNKKNLAQNDGQISALLHLDMQNLGQIDVYVKLQESKVQTKFCVVDDSVLTFLEDKMDLLTQRLKKRGYDCQMSVSTKDIKEVESGLEPLVVNDRQIPLSQYAFDVRT